MATSARLAARRGERLAAALALIAGYIDAYGFVTYRTYLSFMSGNTTQTGSEIGQGDFAAAAPSAVAIASFVIGAFLGALLAYSGRRQSRRLAFAATAALLAAAVGLTRVAGAAGAAAIATLSLAMGVMNAAMSQVGAQSLNIGFVTGTLSTMARHLAHAVNRVPLADAQGTWDTHLHRTMLLLGIWIAFISGALLAGAAIAHVGLWVLLPPLLALLALAAFDPIPPAQ